MSAGKARVQPKRTSKQPARKQPQTLNDEIRRLQQTYALLIAIQHAANYDVDFSVSDALIVILALVNESLAGPGSAGGCAMNALKADSRAYFRALGAHISILRKEQGMTQKELARAPSQRLSPAGIRHAERYARLRKTEQLFVKKIIDVLLERSSPRPSTASS